MKDVSKKDWKLYRERIPKWQENYMERLCREYIELLCSKEDASKRFWTLEERIKKDKKHPGVMIELSRSEMIWDLARLIQLDVITEDDLDGFSEELIEEVRAIIHRG